MTKYNKDYHPKKFLELMSDGKSVVACAAEFEVDKTTIYNWRKDLNKPEFKEAFERGQALSQAWWEEKGKDLVFGKQKGNIIGWIYTMKCRFREDWMERSEQKIELSSPIESMSDKELEKLTLDLTKSLEKKKV